MNDAYDSPVVRHFLEGSRGKTLDGVGEDITVFEDPSWKSSIVTYNTETGVMGFSGDPEIETEFKRLSDWVISLQAKGVEAPAFELIEAEASRDLHADLNRRTAKALGKPFEGEGLSWHDIPEEVAKLKADQDDWRKGVELIASAAGVDTLSCVDINEAVLRLRAENERLCREHTQLSRRPTITEYQDLEAKCKRLDTENAAFARVHGEIR